MKKEIPAGAALGPAVLNSGGRVLIVNLPGSPRGHRGGIARRVGGTGASNGAWEVCAGGAARLIRIQLLANTLEQARFSVFFCDSFRAWVPRLLEHNHRESREQSQEKPRRAGK